MLLLLIHIASDYSKSEIYYSFGNGDPNLPPKHTNSPIFYDIELCFFHTNDFPLINFVCSFRF